MNVVNRAKVFIHTVCLAIVVTANTVNSAQSQTIAEAQDFIEERVADIEGTTRSDGRTLKFEWAITFLDLEPNLWKWREYEIVGQLPVIRKHVTSLYEVNPADLRTPPRPSSTLGYNAVLIECQKPKCIKVTGERRAFGQKGAVKFTEMRDSNFFLIEGGDMVPRVINAMSFLLEDAGAKSSSF